MCSAIGARIVLPSSRPRNRRLGNSATATSLTPLPRPSCGTAIDEVVSEVNATLASYETVKTFAILPADFSEASGELTPSLKVKRDVVAAKFAAVVAGLYGK